MIDVGGKMTATTFLQALLQRVLKSILSKHQSYKRTILVVVSGRSVRRL